MTTDNQSISMGQVGYHTKETLGRITDIRRLPGREFAFNLAGGAQPRSSEEQRLEISKHRGRLSEKCTLTLGQAIDGHVGPGYEEVEDSDA